MSKKETPKDEFVRVLKARIQNKISRIEEGYTEGDPIILAIYLGVLHDILAEIDHINGS